MKSLLSCLILLLVLKNLAFCYHYHKRIIKKGELKPAQVNRTTFQIKSFPRLFCYFNVHSSGPIDITVLYNEITVFQKSDVDFIIDSFMYDRFSSASYQEDINIDIIFQSDGWVYVNNSNFIFSNVNHFDMSYRVSGKLISLYTKMQYFGIDMLNDNVPDNIKIYKNDYEFVHEYEKSNISYILDDYSDDYYFLVMSEKANVKVDINFGVFDEYVSRRVRFLSYHLKKAVNRIRPISFKTVNCTSALYYCFDKDIVVEYRTQKYGNRGIILTDKNKKNVIEIFNPSTKKNVYTQGLVVMNKNRKNFNFTYNYTDVVKYRNLCLLKNIKVVKWIINNTINIKIFSTKSKVVYESTTNDSFVNNKLEDLEYVEIYNQNGTSYSISLIFEILSPSDNKNVFLRLLYTTIVLSVAGVLFIVFLILVSILIAFSCCGDRYYEKGGYYVLKK